MRRLTGAMLMLAGAAGLAFAAPETAMPGAAVYKTSGCAECHGADGKGTAEGPSLIGVGSSFGRAKIVRQIRQGGGAMPAFDETLKPEQIEQLADWLATWKTAPAKE